MSDQPQSQSTNNQEKDMSSSLGCRREGDKEHHAHGCPRILGSPIKKPCRSTTCRYIPKKYPGVFRSHLCSLDLWDQVMKDMKCECSPSNSSSSSPVSSPVGSPPGSPIPSSPRPAFHCCPCFMDRTPGEYNKFEAAGEKCVNSLHLSLDPEASPLCLNKDCPRKNNLNISNSDRNTAPGDSDQVTIPENSQDLEK